MNLFMNPFYVNCQVLGEIWIFGISPPKKFYNIGHKSWTQAVIAFRKSNASN